MSTLTTDRIIISFKGKVSAENGVRIPKLTSSHLYMPERGTCSILFSTTRDESVRSAQLGAMYRALVNDSSEYWPSWAGEDTPGFTVTPIGNGFMSQVTITLDASQRMKRVYA